MRWQGDRTLPKSFIVFLGGFAIFVGEIFPVWMERLEGRSPGSPGVKESMFASWDMFVPTIVLYALLGIFFWWLYRRLHWLVVALLAAGLGTGLEFFLFKPQEGNGGPNVAEDPAGALVFFLIIWPILLVLPYGLFQLGRRWLLARSWSDRAKGWVTLLTVVLIISLIAILELRLRAVEPAPVAQPAVSVSQPSPTQPPTIGYAGCSITHQTAAGYHLVGGTDLWPQEERYDDGTVFNWGNPALRFQRVFDENLATYPKADTIWWQLCLPSHEEPTLEHAFEVIDFLKQRLPEATIYVSTLAPYAHLCEASGETGVQRGQELANQLAAARDDVELGPAFRTLTTVHTESDRCHLEEPGQRQAGEDLKQFFDGLGSAGYY